MHRGIVVTAWKELGPMLPKDSRHMFRKQLHLLQLSWGFEGQAGASHFFIVIGHLKEAKQKESEVSVCHAQLSVWSSWNMPKRRETMQKCDEIWTTCIRLYGIHSFLISHWLILFIHIPVIFHCSSIDLPHVWSLHCVAEEASRESGPEVQPHAAAQSGAWRAPLCNACDSKKNMITSISL